MKGKGKEGDEDERGEERRRKREQEGARTYVSDVGRKTRGGCELLVFYCSLGVICDVVVLSFERLLSRYGPGSARRPLLNNVYGDSVTKSQLRITVRYRKYKSHAIVE